MPRTDIGNSEQVLGNFTAALGVPTLDGLGCPGAGAHASHEHILWRELERRVALMASLMEELD
jgi:glutamate carboxypeptidase